MGGPVVHIKSSVDAWRVNERLCIPFAGHGEHAYFYVEKSNLNTLDVARQLAQICGVPLMQVGYAGLKDKHGITRQWFSVATASDDCPDFDSSVRAANASARVRCLRVERHTHKLRRGQHRANEFVLQLGLADSGGADLVAGMNDWFPNAFGPQRLSPGNLEAARDWLAGAPRKAAAKRRGRQRSSSGRRGWHLSVLRSELFNAVLNARLARGDFNQVLPGDVVDNGIPTGPLWGRGRSATAGVAGEVEARALEPYADVCAQLEFTGLQQDRRVLAQHPSEFAYNVADRQAEISFVLPPGAYATAMLAHTFTLVDDSKPA